jgi:hypothetical protein
VPEHGREYLRGLPGISVSLLGRSGDDLADAQFNSALRADAELRLRQWGVAVLEKTDATLAVSWLVGPPEGQSRSVSADLDVTQRLRSISTGRVWRLTTYTAGREWRKASVQACEGSTPSCREEVRALVHDRIDGFIADWLKVNPGTKKLN